MRPDALAHEVDAVVAEGDARRLEIVDPLRQPVAGEIDAVVREPIRAGPKGVGVRAEGLLAQKVGRVLGVDSTSGQSSTDEPSTPR